MGWKTRGSSGRTHLGIDLHQCRLLPRLPLRVLVHGRRLRALLVIRSRSSIMVVRITLLPIHKDPPPPGAKTLSAFGPRLTNVLPSSQLASPHYRRNVLAGTFALFAKGMYDNLSPPVASSVLGAIAFALVSPSPQIFRNVKFPATSHLLLSARSPHPILLFASFAHPHRPYIALPPRSTRIHPAGYSRSSPSSSSATALGSVPTVGWPKRWNGKKKKRKRWRG